MPDLAAAAETRGAEWLTREVRWRAAHYTLLVLGSVLAAIAGATALADVWNGTVAGVLALTASALTAAAASLRPATMASGCAVKAAEYLALARDVREINEADGTNSAKRHEYYSLLKRYDDIRTTPSPALPPASD
jgi:hypothetical protein